MRLFGKLKKYFWRYKWSYLWGMVLLIVVDLLQLVPPHVIGFVVNGLDKGWMDAAGLLVFAAVLLLVWLTMALTRFGWRYFTLGAANRIERDLRDDFFRHVTKLPTSFFPKHRTGDLMALSSNDMVIIKWALAFVIITFGDVVLMLGGVGYMMCRIDPMLTLYVFIPLPLVSLAFLLFARAFFKLYVKVQESFATLTTRTEENISGIRVVRSYVQEEGEKVKFAKANDDYRGKNLRLAMIEGSFHGLMYVLPSLSYAILLIVGGAKVIRGEILIGHYFEMTFYLGLLIWPMMSIGWVFNMILRASASIKRIWEVMDEADEFSDSPPPIGGIDAPIELKDLTFSYPDATTPAIKNLSMRIEAGETVAVMGRTGSGKSTLISILTRMYDPPPGTVFIGERDILEIPKVELRALFAIAPQEAFLFSQSISENISFARPDAPEDEVKAGARAAHIYDDVMEMEKGFDTVIGERGVNLSGGQKQRTSIARALVANRKVIVLDDTLSAVDTVTEHEILQSLRSEKEGRTVLLITHRVNAAKVADRIVVLDKGRVVEEGTEEELLEARGIYFDVHERQKLEAELEEESE